jgi:hypothetical protein
MLVAEQIYFCYKILFQPLQSSRESCADQTYSCNAYAAVCEFSSSLMIQQGLTHKMRAATQQQQQSQQQQQQQKQPHQQQLRQQQLRQQRHR